MAATFNLPIELNGEEYEYPAEILQQGYTQKVLVDIDGTIVTFEPDEEGNYRALIAPDVEQNISPLLLKEISDTLVELFN